MKYAVSHKKTVGVIEKVMKDMPFLEQTNVIFSEDEQWSKVVNMYIDRNTNELIVVCEE